MNSKLYIQHLNRWARFIPTSFFFAGLFMGFPRSGPCQVSHVFFSPAGQTNPIDDSGYSARSSVMGPAFSAVADDASALFSNPAGLASLDREQLTLEGYFGLGDAVRETAVFGFPTAKGGIALAGSYWNYGTFEGRDASGSLASNYGADRIGFQAGWGTSFIKGLDGGLALHYSQQDLAGNIYSFLTPDIGMLLEPLEGFKIGLDYLSPGLSSASYPMVSTFRSGISWDIPLGSADRIMAALGNSLRSDALDYLQAGTEFSYHSTYFLRAGYRQPFNDNGLSGFSDFSFGAGAVWGRFALDYAYSPAGLLGDSNRFSLTYLFGGGDEGSVVNSQSGRLSPGESGKGRTGSDGKTFLESRPMGPAGISAAPVSVIAGGTSAGNAMVSEPSPVTVFAQPPQLPPTASKAGGEGEDKKSLTLRFDIPADYASQADQMAAQGRYAQALGLYRMAVQQDSQNVTAWWGMGNVYCKLGRKNYAVRCMERVLELRPDDSALRGWLEKYKTQKP